MVAPSFAEYADPQTDDRQFDVTKFAELEADFGPFSVDCCADPLGKNSLCEKFFSVVDSLLKHDLAGLNVWMNCPFRKLEQFLWHYLLSKVKSPSNTSGCFVIPEALVPKLQYLLQDMEVVRYYPKGTRLFTEVWGEGRRYCRGINQGIYVYRDHANPSQPFSQPIQFRDVPQTSASTVPDFTSSARAVDSDLELPTLLNADSHMIVAGKINGVTCRILIDTGARANFISDKFVRAHNIQTLGSAGYCSGALQGQSSMCHNVLTKLKLGSTFMQTGVHFYSAPLSIPHVDAVLGLPWMTQESAVIDVAARAVHIGNTHECKARVPNVEVVTAAVFGKSLRQNALCFAVSIVLKEEEPSKATLNCPGGTIIVDAAHSEVVASVLQDFEIIFQEDLPVGIPTRSIQHTIELIPGAKPFARNQYRLSPVELEEVRKQVEYLLSKGLIAPSSSPWSAPVLFTPKPDGTLRFCIDYRGLNKQTIRDRYPLPRTDELLDKVSKAKFFTKLDLRAGYWQIPIVPECRPMTAFTTRFGLFEWQTMPFGLTGAPATFSRLMNMLLHPHLDKFVVVYLDDILIYSESLAEHEQHVRMICEILKREGLQAKLSKCSFFKSQVEYLGHIVGRGELRADPRKLGHVDQWPQPANVGELRSFLGLCSYFRRFIKSFAKIAQPLHELTGKVQSAQWAKNPLAWTPLHQRAFEQLKQALTSAPVLTAPDYSKPFLVYTDASALATGAILAQADVHGHIQPICFYSRKLKPAEVNYPAHDMELLAIVEALREWRCYLEGSPFTAIVRTDHKPLLEFFTQKSLSRRQARWWERIHAFDFELKYVKGAENPADALSRNPVYAHSAQVVGFLAPPTYVVTQVQSYLGVAALIPNNDLLNRVKIATPMDSWFESHAAKRMQLTNSEGVYRTRNGQVVVPNDAKLKQDILSDAHDSKIAGHRGARPTLKAVTACFWWPGMNEEIKLFVQSCLHCQRNKAGNKHNRPPSQPLPVPTAQFQSITMDLITDLPESNSFDSIFVVVDRLTKMVFAFPCNKTATAGTLARLLMEHVVLKGFGLPKNIVTDRDPRFMSEVWQTLMTLIGTKHKPSTAFHPQTDGQTERYNRVLEEVLRNYIDPAQHDWADLLPYAVFVINNTVHSVTQHTPYFLHQGFHPRTPLNWHKPEPEVVPSLSEWFNVQRSCLEKAKSLLSAANGRMEKSSTIADFVVFKVGDKVLLNSKNLKFKAGSKKLHPKFCGPFEVLRVIRDTAYELQLPKEMGKVHPVFHGSLLKAFVPSDRHDAPPAPLLVDEDTYFLVEKVLKHRVRGGKTKKGNKVKSGKLRFDLLVSWQGFGSEYDCWVKEEDCTQLLTDDYWAHIGGKPQ
jgi:hypothetical protein